MKNVSLYKILATLQIYLPYVLNIKTMGVVK